MQADIRRRLEAAIEKAIDAGIDVTAAIALLDALDDDPDLEPAGDEADTSVLPNIYMADDRDLPACLYAGPTISRPEVAPHDIPLECDTARS